MGMIGDQFIGQYSLQKTLRFELRPIGETQKLLQDFKEEVQGNLLEYDAERARAYPMVKKVLDDYYRYFIDQVLSGFAFDSQTINEVYEMYKKAKKDAEAAKEYAVHTKKLREQLSAAFKAPITYYMLDKYEHLFNRNRESRLFEWLDIRFENDHLTENEYDEIKDVLDKFDKFTTYFTGYKENRANLFVADEKATAIAYRVVNENMPRFFENCIRMENIKKRHLDLYKLLDSFEGYFVPQAYANIICQPAITDYNKIIGRPTQNPDEKGVNSIINEYRQKNQIKNRELPMMAQLYKQLLSDRITVFSDPVINNDEEMQSIVAETIEIARGLFSEVINLTAIHALADNSENIYINSSALANLSHRVYDDWNLIYRACEEKMIKLEGKQKKGLENKLKMAIPMSELQNIIEEYIATLDEELKLSYYKIPILCDYFQNPPLDDFESATLKFEQIVKTTTPRTDLIHAIKEVLDKAMEVVRFFKPLYLFKGRSPLEVPDRNEDFYNEFERLYAELNLISKIYDRVRNYATKKQFSQDKIKLNFNNPTLLDGWDLNKEQDNLCVILIRDGNYYLALMNRDYRRLFDLKNDEVRNKALGKAGDHCYSKLEYKQVTGANKMLPKVLFAATNSDLFKPSQEILDIRKTGSHKKEAGNIEALHKWIDFCKQSIATHPEWNDHFDFKFRSTSEYSELTEFYNDFDRQAYKIKFVDIKVEYIDQLVKEGKLYLFQIYNKDFSPYSKGRPNLHTTYWRMLFGNENLANITMDTDRPIFKLNGEAEIFFRKASLEKQITHAKGQPITNKSKKDNGKESESIFEYDLIKDKRYTEDKLFFHCPITINFRAPGTTVGSFNRKVNYFVERNPEVKIIGIDRGERHLLYYTVIDQKGNILEQGSLNQIHNSYTSAGRVVEHNINYRDLLHEKEKGREEARKNWETIENIKELKAGYLSQIVNLLSNLMIKYNAVLVLEDLNAGFKRSRIKVEKQVYQKFEKAMIDKLNYLVFKELPPGSSGHYLNGYQLTAPFTSFRDLGRQSGFLYYVYPSYTSHICPKTGFVNLLNTRYESIEKAISFFEKFNSIKYNPGSDYFEFDFDYASFGKDVARSQWCVCTAGEKRYYYANHDKTSRECNATQQIKELLDKYNIEYIRGKDLLPEIIKKNDKGFFNGLMFLLGVVLQMRYTVSGTSNDDDFILSPVMDEQGQFFDSRSAATSEPQNADANGAYHIALKGLKIISSISDGKLKTVNKNERQDWFAYVQNKMYR